MAYHPDARPVIVVTESGMPAAPSNSVNGQAVMASSAPVVIASNQSAIPVNAASTPVAASAFAVTTAATTNATSVKTSAGSLYEVSISNVTATAIFVKFYNKASAPTVGTDVPILTLSVPATTTLALPFGAVGKRFSTGIALAATAAALATDTGVAVAGVQISGTYL